MNIEENDNLSEFVQGKKVVVDTSSLLIAGTGLLNNLSNCSIIIPAIVVKELEEKRTHATVGFLSREWLRLLEKLRVERGKELSKGVILPDYENITLLVEPNHRSQKSLPEHLQDGSHDSTILAVAKNLKDEEEIAKHGDSNSTVVLLSNDAPMRLHSTLDLDIPAYEFSATKLVGAKPFDGRYQIEVSDSDYEKTVNKAILDENLIELNNYVIHNLPKGVSKNAYITLEKDGQILSHLLYVNGKVEFLRRKHKATEITAKNQEQDVAFEFLRKPVDEMTVVSLGGSAGSGKTLVTMAVALDELRLGNYQKVMVFRSLHEMGAGQEMGFLPGDVNEKMHAWAGAIYDAIDVLAVAKKPLKKNAGPAAENAQKKEAERLRDMVEIAPITYLRGRSLSNTFIILEEAQNFSRSEILNILSRAGAGSKIVLTFDAAQVDNRFLQPGKNADIWSVIDSLKEYDIFAHITLKRTERSRIAEIASTILEN